MKDMGWSKTADIRKYVDLGVMEKIMKEWSVATGMATIAMDAKGEYVSGEIGFTDFCMKYTRGSQEGKKRCVQCDKDGKDTYFCHAGLMDFSKEIVVDDTYFGKIIGGQVLPKEPDEAEFRKIADEIGVDQDKYIEALKKVKVSNMEAIKAGADMLGDIITQMVSSAYYEKNSDIAMHKLDEVEACFNEIFSTVSNLSQIERNQKILALNASIEAARAGEHGRGFAIVAKKVETLASDIGNYNSEITGKLNKLAELMKQITQGK